MQLQLSVFHRGHYFSYAITTSDRNTVCFHLKSAPPGEVAPLQFEAIRQEKERWLFSPVLEEDFAAAVETVLHKAKL